MSMSDAEIIKNLLAEIAIDNMLLADRDRILDTLPCPVHGRCVPYVLQWIEKQGQ